LAEDEELSLAEDEELSEVAFADLSDESFDVELELFDDELVGEACDGAELVATA